MEGGIVCAVHVMEGGIVLCCLRDGGRNCVVLCT